MNDRPNQVDRPRRNYAGYFHVAGDDRSTELDVVREWIVARFGSGGAFVSIEHRTNPNDPPDVVLVGTNGLRWGVEVTELVDSRTIRRRIRNPEVLFSRYSEYDLRRDIAGIVERKRSCEWKDPSSDLRILVIYTDEPDVSFGEASEFVDSLPAVTQDRFDEMWLLRPPIVAVGDTETEDRRCRIAEIKKA